MHEREPRRRDAYVSCPLPIFLATTCLHFGTLSAIPERIWNVETLKVSSISLHNTRRASNVWRTKASIQASREVASSLESRRTLRRPMRLQDGLDALAWLGGRFV